MQRKNVVKTTCSSTSEQCVCETDCPPSCEKEQTAGSEAKGGCVCLNQSVLNTEDGYGCAGSSSEKKDDECGCSEKTDRGDDDRDGFGCAVNEREESSKIEEKCSCTGQCRSTCKKLKGQAQEDYSRIMEEIDQSVEKETLENELGSKKPPSEHKSDIYQKSEGGRSVTDELGDEENKRKSATSNLEANVETVEKEDENQNKRKSVTSEREKSAGTTVDIKRKSVTDEVKVDVETRQESIRKSITSEKEKNVEIREETKRKSVTDEMEKNAESINENRRKSETGELQENLVTEDKRSINEISAREKSRSRTISEGLKKDNVEADFVREEAASRKSSKTAGEIAIVDRSSNATGGDVGTTTRDKSRSTTSQPKELKPSSSGETIDSYCSCDGPCRKTCTRNRKYTEQSRSSKTRQKIVCESCDCTEGCFPECEHVRLTINTDTQRKSSDQPEYGCLEDGVRRSLMEDRLDPGAKPLEEETIRKVFNEDGQLTKLEDTITMPIKNGELQSAQKSIENSDTGSRRQSESDQYNCSDVQREPLQQFDFGCLQDFRRSITENSRQSENRSEKPYNITRTRRESDNSKGPEKASSITENRRESEGSKGSKKVSNYLNEEIDEKLSNQRRYSESSKKSAEKRTSNVKTVLTEEETTTKVYDSNGELRKLEETQKIPIKDGELRTEESNKKSITASEGRRSSESRRQSVTFCGNDGVRVINSDEGCSEREENKRK